MSADGMPSRTRLLVVFLLGVALTAVIVVIVQGAVNSIATRETQKTNTSKIDSSAQTLRIVKDCVLPSGKCYRRGEARTAGVVNILTMRQIATVACADAPGTQTPAEIKACVDRTLRIYAAAHHNR